MEVSVSEAPPQYPEPTALYQAGFAELVSVIPPGAVLSPGSKVNQSQIGKCPGRKLHGVWAGYDWRRYQATADDVAKWRIDGANFGVRSDRFPGVDIDSLDPKIAQIVEDFAIQILGPAPIRIGRAPKRLLMYRTAEPFTRMRLWIKQGDDHQLVEFLGQGQQYLIYGTHPGTMKPYSWNQDLVALGAEGLTTITREQAQRFMDELQGRLEVLSVGVVTREGDGRLSTRTAAADQASLLAPSIELLREAVALIPNTNDLFDSRDDYLRMGYAIRAAAGEASEEDGFDIFAEWAGRWEGNDRFPEGNDPEIVRADWRRMKGPYALGFSWIAEHARPFGFSDAQLEFEAVERTPEEGNPAPAYMSDQWLAQEIVQRRSNDLRFVPAQGRWLIWDGSRWAPDNSLSAENMIVLDLRRISDSVAHRGITVKAKESSESLARRICSAGKLAAVRSLVQSNRAIALDPALLDQNAWVLNTPAGIVDLRTGRLGAADPAQLCTKITAVAPGFSAERPEWRRFLGEATGGDRELEEYLQRLCGYALTGSTQEQSLSFIWGPGGNGKSVFLNALSSLLGDYARVATMDTFTASLGDRHTTDLAMLQGARLVTASETNRGKRWDEARVKSLTGGEPVTARFMRQDNFTYTPHFKLVFVGNYRPEIAEVDLAMRRRIQIVPFTVTPARVDLDLGEKVREEWPAILAWMIEGCLSWQREGLNPPTIVRAATNEYFVEQDALGQWLDEECELGPGVFTETGALFERWMESCNGRGERVGSVRQFSQALANRGFARGKHPDNRRHGFYGIALREKVFLGFASVV